MSTSWQTLAEMAMEPVGDPGPSVTAACLEALPDTIALLRLNRGVPECIRAAATSGYFCSVVQEPSAATAWVPRRLLPPHRELVEREGSEEVDPGIGWCALRVGRFGSGKNGLKVPAAPGVAHGICAHLQEESVIARLLAAAGTEVILVPEHALPRAAAVLVEQGHAVWPCTRVCDPAPWAKHRPLRSEAPLLKRLAGAWSLVQQEQPPGTITEEHNKGDGPMRLQASNGLFVELRIPPATSSGGLLRGDSLSEASCGGRCRVIDEDGQALCTQLRTVDFQAPTVEVPRWQLTLGASSVVAMSGDRREFWARLGGSDAGDIVALELQSEKPEPKTARAGIWIFTGRRFAKVIGLPRGHGLVGQTCCNSLGQLRRLRGQEEVHHELRGQYEAMLGSVKEPGLLTTKRCSWHPENADTIYYDAADDSTGEVIVKQEHVIHVLPSGKREIWRIVEWSYDPFSLEENRTKPRARLQKASAAAPEVRAAKRPNLRRKRSPQSMSPIAVG